MFRVDSSEDQHALQFRKFDFLGLFGSSNAMEDREKTTTK
jgi:hypothetical protein